MAIRKIGSLQIESSAASQSILFWRVQRFIVTILILFLIAVALGLTGPGLLDKKIVGDKLLVIGDASQQAITSNDYSVINAVIIIITFVVMDLGMAYLKSRSKKIEQFMDGSPVILINNGKQIKKMMKLTDVDIEDILEAGRREHGLSSLDQIKYAVLEKDGDITIVPY